MTLKTIGKSDTRKLDYHTYFTMFGRNSLEYIMRNMDKTLIYMLPDFHCDEILKVFDKHNVKYNFYHINEDLTIDWDSVDSHYCDVFYAISYFGVKHDYDPIMFNKILLEDNVFNVDFDIDDRFKDYIGFNSYRKITPLQSGSLLKSTIKFKKWMYYIPANMLTIIQNMHNVDELITVHKNYLRLDDKLKQYSISEFANIGFYTIKINNRDQVQEKLFKHKIYLPVFWKNTPNKLSEQIMSIPIDSRYNESDMERVSKQLCRFL